MVAGSRPLAAPDNLMDGAPEERNSSRRRWGRRGQWEGGGREKQQKNKTGEKKSKRGKKLKAAN